MIQDWLGKLTDVFKKTKDSNIGKLFTLVDEEINQLKSALTKTEEWRDLYKAEGTTLNLMGESLNQPRGQTSDEIYRVLIRGKSALNLADGTMNKIIEVLSLTLDCDPTEIEIKTLKETGDNEPAALMITKAPLEALNRVGMSPHQFAQLAQKTAAGGVRIALVNFQGTFRFAVNPKELEEGSDGFLSDGIDGGTLGGVYTPQKEDALPI
ncbi:hypothetical protein [Priestia endophytica]|uniref:Uncharacterized protein n=1 Tax=Priestia endophytica TaxID=135735 RepID=A0AAX1Q6F7_9BACI|nr:hypothetical protein [Priestia endophytica]RAS75253.1 hypothetical protein A3864_16440 [Priestia endophytica]